MSDIVERLRDWKAQYRGDGDEQTIPLASEAAEEITRLRAENERLQGQYMDLIMQVGKKYPDETRHETARRYIQQAERSPSIEECQALQETDDE